MINSPYICYGIILPSRFALSISFSRDSNSCGFNRAISEEDQTFFSPSPVVTARSVLVTALAASTFALLGLPLFF